MEQAPLVHAPAGAPPRPSEELARLGAILRVVEDLGGNRSPERSGGVDFDARHDRAAGVVRERYARRAARTASASAAGVAALIGTRASDDARRSAADYLAGEMRHAIGALAGALR